MPRKKKKRRHAGRSSIAAWVILAGSLSIIGFACSRSPQAIHTQAAPRSVAQATHVAAPRASPAPLPAAPSPEPTIASPSPSAAPSPRVTASIAPEPTTSAKPATGTARLALIIDDCGQWIETERGFIALPVTLTLSVLPSVRFSQTVEHEAVNGNKGVMLHLPMEPLSGINPGPGKVTTEMDDGAIAAQVQRDLADVDLARGVNNHEGSRATANVRVMNDVMAVLAKNDRFFIDSRTNSASVAERIAGQHGVASAGRDVFLDNRADVAYTEAQLRDAVAIAKRDGSAIAIGHPRPTTLIAVRALIPEIEAAGVKFVLAADLTR